VNVVHVGLPISIFIAFADICVHVFPATSWTNIHTYWPLFVCVLSVQLVHVFVYPHDVVGQLAVPVYIHFVKLNVLHHASAHVIVIVSLCTGHTNTLSVKLAVGFVLSNLYVPLHVLLFVAKSVAHKYNVLSHSVLSVITVLFVYTVPAAVQFAALIQLYFAVPVFASVCVNVIEVSVFFHVVELFVALIVGAIVS